MARLRENGCAMDEPIQAGPQDPEGPPEIVFIPTETGFSAQFAADRRKFLRRTQGILAAGVVSFTLVTWILVHRAIVVQSADQDPVQVVRVEIGALGRGDLQSAYSQLSDRYRREVPFESYHRLFVEHRRAFLARAYRVIGKERRGGETFVDALIESTNGEHYTARFTLVQTGGRWWIDDLHWDASNRKMVRA